MFNKIWSNFLKVWGVPSTILGIILTFLSWKFTPEYEIPLVYFVLVLFFMIIILIVLFSTVIELFNDVANIVPSVIMVRKSSDDLDAPPLCLLSPSKLFSVNTLVSAYYSAEDGFELLVGTGRVLTIQENKNIQVLLTDFVNGREDIIYKLKNNDQTVIPKIKIKPSIPFM